MPIATPQGTLDFKSVDKVTFVGASSNTVIDTTTGSLGVGVGVNGPTSNLHVVGHTRLEGDINMLHTSNTASIKLNSNVVTEFPRSKKLIKYPRVVLTANGLNQGYTVSGSNEYSSGLTYYGAFTPPTTLSTPSGAWLTPTSGTTGYSASTGDYLLSEQLHNESLTGEFVQIVLPERINPVYFTVQPRPESANNNQGLLSCIKEGEIWASNNNGTTWTLVGTIQNFTPTDLYQQYIVNDINVTGYYDTFALIIHKNNGQVFAGVGEWQLFGLPEYDPDAAGVDVKVTSYPNVPNTDWLEVYYDAKDLANGSITNVDDLTPNGTNDGTASNVTVSDGAFVFNGTSSLLEKTSLSIPGGDNPFTFSFWLKNDDFDSTQYILRLGDNQTMYQNVNIYKTSSNQIVFTTWLLDFPINYTFTSNRWNHISLMYPGGGWEQSNLIVYVDGKRFNFGANRSSGGTGGNVMTLATSLTLRLGGFSSGNMHFNGKIANFRLFNRALTSDEIWQLYAYQKEYFGHGDLSMTLKAGRLDVPGDISCDGVVKPYTCAFAAYASSGGNSSTTGIFPAGSVYFNIGNCYNTSTYVFTAPVHGIYHMSFSAFTNQSPTSSSRIYALLNGVTTMQVGATIQQHGNSLSLTVEMQAGDTFHFNGGSGVPIYYFGAGAHNRFCGHLICAL